LGVEAVGIEVGCGVGLEVCRVEELGWVVEFGPVGKIEEVGCVELLGRVGEIRVGCGGKCSWGWYGWE
jgi:hypothetical protein